MGPDSIVGMLEFFVGGVAVLVFLISRVIKALRSEDRTESKAPARKKRPPERSPYAFSREAAAGVWPAFRSEAADHEHITAGGISTERRLEQLDTLLEAGLLDKEEYRERKEKIEEEGR